MCLCVFLCHARICSCVPLTLWVTLVWKAFLYLFVRVPVHLWIHTFSFLFTHFWCVTWLLCCAPSIFCPSHVGGDGDLCPSCGCCPPTSSFSNSLTVHRMLACSKVLFFFIIFYFKSVAVKDSAVTNLTVWLRAKWLAWIIFCQLTHAWLFVDS